MDENSVNLAFIKTKNRKTAKEYSLLLDSIGIENNLIFQNNSWGVGVFFYDYRKACYEIKEYEKSGGFEYLESNFSHIRFQKINVPLFLFIFVFLLSLHIFIYEFNNLYLLKAGSSNASAINEGEFFRAITALTLHTDYRHLFSNLIFGGIVFYSLATLTGSGFAALLALLSGFAGNLANALFYGSAHNSIGASTAVFGIVGTLAGLQFFDKFRKRGSARWIPLAAALGLLAMLGSSEKSDVLAHLFGLVFGLPLGFLYGKSFSEREIPQKFAQRICVSIFILILFLSWAQALAANFRV